MDNSTYNLASMILGVIQTAAILTGAVWAYFRFAREGTHKSRIECDLDCNFLGPKGSRCVADFGLHVTNVGHVAIRFPDIRLRVRGIKADTDLQNWKGREPLLAFPEEVFGTVNIVPEEMKYYFVRPGVLQRFSFVTSVPKDWQFLIARVSFKYDSSDELHTAERVFEVKPRDAA